MSTDNKNLQDEELKKDDTKSANESDEALKRGQEAIKAEQLIDPDTKEDKAKDAERWRNEG